MFIGYPIVFLKIYSYINQLGFGDDPDYSIIKKLIKQSLAENWGTSKIGNWEPFRSKLAKTEYLQDNLDSKAFEEYDEDSYLVNEDKEYFVNSFTNFKSYDVDELQGENINDFPEKIVSFVWNYDFITKSNIKEEK